MPSPYRNLGILSGRIGFITPLQGRMLKNTPKEGNIRSSPGKMITTSWEIPKTGTEITAHWNSLV
jgi:hypothetical protein